MLTSVRGFVAATLIAGSALTAVPAFADETDVPSEFTISGSVGGVSDYRFRGVSQTDKNMAVQGGITVGHESGVYVGTWASNLSGWGTFGGSNMELDIIGGYKAQIADNATLDVGLTWYMYPGGADTTDFAEAYVKLTGTTGPATLTAGVAYAPKQEALGRWFFTGADAASGIYNDPGDKEDNAYVWGDAAVAVGGTPFTLKAHIGHSWGNKGLGPNGTSVTPTGSYWDWSVGADTTWKNLTLGVSYVDTDISNADAAYLQPGFSRGLDGSGSIADGTVLVSLTAAF